MLWLHGFNPSAYLMAVTAANRSVARSSRSMLSGLDGWWDSISSAVSSLGSSVASAAKTVVPGLLQYEGQRKLLNLQISRANQGLPPLNTSQISLPPVQVRVSPSPQITESLSRAVEAGTSKTWMYLAGAVVLVGGLWMFARNR
ncbi:MAG TPA: hypothetical protein ENG77_02915 [Chromatiales bacterium]|nr:hypothetical protein [Chromatiales bacterium]